MGKDLKGRVKYMGHIAFNKKGEQITTQREAWREDAKCGCGIDCCENTLVLADKSTGRIYNIFVEDGVLKATPKDGIVDEGSGSLD